VLDGIDTPRSPAWWIKILATELQDRRQGRSGSRSWSRKAAKPQRIRPGIDLLLDHLAGDPPLLGVADGWKDHFNEVARLGRLNVAALVVEAKADRMPLRGFRTAAADDELGDSLARDLMRANQLMVRSREVHDFMLGTATGYGMATPPKKGSRWSLITAEDPREVITAHDPATGQTLASIKAYRDDWDSADFIHLYVRQSDDTILHHTAVHRSKTSAFTAGRFRFSDKWEWTEGGEAGAPMSRMPIVRFQNRRGVGEFEQHIDTLDRINDQILNKLVIAKVQAFRQMAIKGLPDSEKKIVDGKLQEVEIDYDDAFVTAPGSLWQLPAGVDLWESAVTDLTPIRMAIKDDLEHLAAVTSTPLHIITPDAASGSAEGASLMREQHVYAVESCRDHADVGWSELMATAFAFMDDEYRYGKGDGDERFDRGDVTQIQPIWGPSERYSLAERYDAGSKAKLPLEAIWRDIYQYDPAEIPNLRTLGARDLLTRIGNTPPAAGQPQGQPPLAPTFQPPALPADPGGTGDPAAAS
jgi:hypothetical protein